MPPAQPESVTAELIRETGNVPAYDDYSLLLAVRRQGAGEFLQESGMADDFLRKGFQEQGARRQGLRIQLDPVEPCKRGWPGRQPRVRLRSKNTAESDADEPVPALGRGNRNAGDQRIDNLLYEAQHLLHTDAGQVLRLGSCHCCPFGMPESRDLRDSETVKTSVSSTPCIR